MDVMGLLVDGGDLISNGLGDEEHVSKAKFAGSPESNSPCGGGKGPCVVVNENLRANLRAFSMSRHPKLSFWGGFLFSPYSLCQLY